MDRTETLRLKNQHGIAKDNVYVSVFWEGGSRTFGPLTLDARTGEIPNVLPAKFDNPITSLRINWSVNHGKTRQQDVRAHSECYFASFDLEWEASGRRRLTAVERQSQESVQMEAVAS